MPYLLIQDFKLGLDSRRNILTSPPGSLIKCSNAHVTRGGEVEKRKAFELISSTGYYVNPPGSYDPTEFVLDYQTYGIEATGEGIFVFGEIRNFNAEYLDPFMKNPNHWANYDALKHFSDNGLKMMYLYHPSDILYYIGPTASENALWKLNRIVWSTVYDGMVFVIAEWICPYGFNQYAKETYVYYDDGVDYTYLIAPNDPIKYRVAKPIDAFYKGMVRAIDGDKYAMNVKDWMRELVRYIKNDPDFVNSSLGADEKSIIIEGPIGKEFILEALVMSPQEKYKDIAAKINVTTELLQSRIEPTTEVQAKSKFSVVGGSESRASSFVQAYSNDYTNIKITQFFVETEELLDLSLGSSIQWNSGPNINDYESTGGKLLHSLSHYINLGTSTHGFEAKVELVNNKYKWYKLTIYGPPEDPSSYNGFSIYIEYDNTLAECSEGKMISGSISLIGTIVPSTRSKPGSVATNPSGVFHEAKFGSNGGTLSGAVENSVSQIMVDGVDILGSKVYWSGSHVNTMSDITSQINQHQNNYDAALVDNEIVLTAVSGGSMNNNYSITAVVSGNLLFSPFQTFSGGSDSQPGIPQKNKITIGVDGWDSSITPPDSFQLAAGARLEVNTKIGDEVDYVSHLASDVTGTDPVHALGFRSKMNISAGKSVYFSELEDPTSWGNDVTGSGFINFSNNFSQNYGVQAICPYSNYLSILAERNIQIWNWDPDPEKNSQQQVLANTGAISPGAVCAIGDIDVFYVSNSGIRSLRARDASNSAMTTDIGTQIDSFVSKSIEDLGGNHENISSVIEPNEGRYMVSIGDKIYVLSYFQNSGIQAWSTYEPNFGQIEKLCVTDRDLYVRTTLGIYKMSKTLYSTNVDPNIAEIIMPYLDGQKPAHGKTFYGIDATVEGLWQISGGTNTSNTSAVELIATINNPTFQLGRIMFTGIGTHVGIKMVSPANETAKSTIGNIMVHYKLNNAD